MCFTVNGEMQLTPDTAAFLAMLLTFLPSPKTFSPWESNYPVCGSPRVGVLKLTLTDFARLLTRKHNPGSVAGDVHQKNGINKALRSPQSQPEYAPFNDQHSSDSKVRIALRSAS